MSGAMAVRAAWVAASITRSQRAITPTRSTTSGTQPSVHAKAWAFARLRLCSAVSCTATSPRSIALAKACPIVPTPTIPTRITLPSMALTKPMLDVSLRIDQGIDDPWLTRGNGLLQGVGQGCLTVDTHCLKTKPGRYLGVIHRGKLRP